MKNILITSLFLVFITVTSFAGEAVWVNLSDSHQYNKSSIKKIDEATVEVYDASGNPKGYSERQLRVNCQKEQFAIVHSEIYISGSSSPASVRDFGKSGWTWYDPGSQTEKELISIVCNDQNHEGIPVK